MNNYSLSISPAELKDSFEHLITAVTLGSKNASAINGCNVYQDTSLVFLPNTENLDQLLLSPPAILVTTENIAAKFSKQKTRDSSIFQTKNVALAHAKIKQHYADYDNTDSEWEAIHASAIIHESATIDSSCRIGPNVIIGANVSIGEKSIIRNASVIEHDSEIGKHCVIHSSVNIGFGTKIGDKVIVRPNTVIANEGFGLSQDDQHRHHRVPHTGMVVIEDDVQIGSCSNIDRGTYGETRIKRGTKIDAQCHIAHNVEIGEDCILTAQCVIAGSSKIGNRVLMSGKSGISDHVTICDDVILLHRASVFSDIKKSGQWAGTPVKPFKEYVQDLRTRKQIDKLTTRLETLEKKLNR